MSVTKLFGDVLPRSFDVIGQFMKKCCLLLFSINVGIGQFSFKWPGSSSCTVIHGIILSIRKLSRILRSRVLRRRGNRSDPGK